MIEPNGRTDHALLRGVLCLSGVVFACDTDHVPLPPSSVAAPQPQAVAVPARPFIAHGYSVEHFCPEICRRTHALGCRAMSDCDELCRGAFADLVCPQLLQPAMECALSQPLTSWFCSPDGIGAVKDGSCEREQIAYEACLAAIK